ncbi:MAG: glutamate--tRNA ligase [Chloroflexi bacterium]|nr:glutamate--tRNA ligase [Chloroflexota bacterium]
MTLSPARVRFAPSPTGYFHIGGARTALFNWLYARHTGGQFILRIEDTDRARFHPDALQDHLDGLRWLGLDWDEGPEVGGEYGPYFQSERLEIYQKWADWLVEQGKAYRCYCTSAELQEMRERQRAQKEKIGYDRRCRWLTPEERAAREAEGRSWVVRLAVPLEGEVTFNDAIRGDITYANAELQDAVLLKSDGWPTYHLANVIDDHLMKISHIMRGDEWIASVPLHWHLYQAFAWEPPVWAHLPVILNPSGKGKVSKRAIQTPSGATIPVFVHDYRKMGYLAEAVVNFLTGIGWSLDGETEIYDRETAIAAFDIRNIQASPAAFPAEKLEWMNGMYIRQLSVEALHEALVPFLSDSLGIPEDAIRADTRLRLLIPAIQERLKTLRDAAPLIDFLWAEEIPIESPAALIPRKTTPAQVQQSLEKTITYLERIDVWDEAHIEEALRALVEELGMKAGQVFSPIRVAVTGKKVAPPLFATLAAVGKETVLARLRKALNLLASAG